MKKSKKQKGNGKTTISPVDAHHVQNHLSSRIPIFFNYEIIREKKRFAFSFNHTLTRSDSHKDAKSDPVSQPRAPGVRGLPKRPVPGNPVPPGVCGHGYEQRIWRALYDSLSIVPEPPLALPSPFATPEPPPAQAPSACPRHSRVRTGIPEDHPNFEHLGQTGT